MLEFSHVRFRFALFAFWANKIYLRDLIMPRMYQLLRAISDSVDAILTLFVFAHAFDRTLCSSIIAIFVAHALNSQVPEASS